MNAQLEIETPTIACVDAARMHGEMAVIALKRGASAAVIKVATDHLERALAALKPERTKE